MKKLLALILAMAMVLSLAACGSSDSDSSSGTEAAEAAEEAEESGDEEEAGDTEEAGDEEETSDFNPDEVEDAMTIEELREANGAEVTVPADVSLGVVEKSLSNEFWRTLSDGYDAASADTGVDIAVNATTDESDEIGQQTMTETLITQGVSALMLSPISDSNLTAAVENANNEGIVTVNVNDGLIADAEYYVGPMAYENGQLAAAWISEQLGDEGQVAVVIGMAKAFAARQRTAGFEDWIADNNSGLEIVAEQNADWDRQTAKELASTWIQQNPDLKAIFCNNDDMALGVVEAVEEEGADILVVGVDGIGEAYDSIRDGKLDATVDSFPYYMAQVATEVTIRALGGEDVPRVVHTPQALICADNIDDDPEDLINWTAPVYVTE